jgi:(1->4)-alpha-D-glucan 1-alpha-D-glucosylmutase
MIQVCERNRRYRDYTRYEVYEAIREVMACFPVYRSYVRAEAGMVSDHDRAVIEKAIGAAKSFRPELDPELFDFMKARSAEPAGFRGHFLQNSGIIKTMTV